MSSVLATIYATLNDINSYPGMLALKHSKYNSWDWDKNCCHQLKY